MRSLIHLAAITTANLKPVSEIRQRDAGAPGNSRRETDGQLDSRILRMNLALARADDEFGLDPRLAAKPLRQIVRAHHPEQCDKRRIALAKNHRTPPHDDKIRFLRAGLDAGELGGLGRKYAREETAGREMFRRGRTVIRHRAAQLETTGELLRMFTLHPGPERKIRRTAGDEIELLLGLENASIAKIPFPDSVAVSDAVLTGGLSGERNTFTLRFNGDKVRPGQTPRGNHPHRADAAAEIQSSLRRRTPTRAIPRREDVVGREAMTIAQLKQAEVSANGV